MPRFSRRDNRGDEKQEQAGTARGLGGGGMGKESCVTVVLKI